MICVTVEVLPHGDEARAREIARMNIANISDLAPVSDYEVRASNVANPISGQPAFVARGMIEGHRRTDSIWTLIAKAAGLVASQLQ